MVLPSTTSRIERTTETHLAVRPGEPRVGGVRDDLGGWGSVAASSSPAVSVVAAGPTGRWSSRRRTRQVYSERSWRPEVV